MPTELLPKGLEIKIKVFSAVNLVKFVNVETGQIVESRAFDWDSLEPIFAGEERFSTNKEFVYTPTSATVAYQFIFKRLGWKRLASIIGEKLGCKYTPEWFESQLKQQIKEGTRRILIISKANSIGRFTCENNVLIFWKGENFLLDDVDFETGWNKRLENAKAKWKIVK